MSQMSKTRVGNGTIVRMYQNVKLCNDNNLLFARAFLLFNTSKMNLRIIVIIKRKF